MFGHNRASIQVQARLVRNHSRRDTRWRPFALLLMLSILVVSCQKNRGESTASIPSTGFTVLQELEAQYDQYGPQLLGEPITGACEMAGGGVAQYFDRMRLEIGSDGQQVKFFPLGEWAYGGVRVEVATPSVTDYSRQRHFPETDYAVYDEFLAFYEGHQGEVLLGPPISPQLDEGGLRVQYFRNGRLEWHPDAPLEERVQVSTLGRAHYAQAAHDVSCDFRARPMEVSAAQEVRVEASVSAPILYEGLEQTIYVDVTTIAGVPVNNVPVRLEVVDGEEAYSIVLGRTDDDGKVHGTLQLRHFEPGQKITVYVNAYTADNTVIGSTALSFQTWW